MKEQDLFQPVKELFENMAYEVYGEVNTVDIIAKFDDTIIAIELKKEFSLQLIAQGAKRQQLTDFSYLAIPLPTQKVIRGNIFKDKLFILKRLGVGLILVNTKVKPYRASIYTEPVLTEIKLQQSRHKKKRAALLKELKNRHSNYNIGGTRGKTITAYRENVLKILHCFADGNTHTTKEVKEASGVYKTTNILYQDHYNWFNKVDRALYEINDNGKKALEEYHHIIKDLTDSQ